MRAGSARRIELSDRQRLAWLRLIRSENVGPVSFRALVNRFGSADAALEALPDIALKGGARRPPRVASLEDAEAEIDAAREAGAVFVAMGESDYPDLLRSIDAAPPLLTIRGSTGAAERPGVGIVGARNASLAGIRMARSLARDLGQAGYTVVSGLARGIDAAAHDGSLASGTIAALAGGIDCIYPPEHTKLADAIVRSGGALISEMPMGWEPRARDFPRRNRIIAGLSLGLVVVEAAMRSGSLISARLAGEFGRLVFAVPGSPLDPRAAGTNGLIRKGVTLVTNAADVLEDLAPLSQSTSRRGERFDEVADLTTVGEPAADERGRLIECLSPVPAPIDEIIRHTGLPSGQVHLILLELDLAGRIQRHGDGSVSLT